jgi:hypothetical protein
MRSLEHHEPITMLDESRKQRGEIRQNRETRKTDFAMEAK